MTRKLIRLGLSVELLSYIFRQHTANFTSITEFESVAQWKVEPEGRRWLRLGGLNSSLIKWISWCFFRTVEKLSGKCSPRDLAYLQIHETRQESQHGKATGSPKKVSSSNSQVSGSVLLVRDRRQAEPSHGWLTVLFCCALRRHHFNLVSAKWTPCPLAASVLPAINVALSWSFVVRMDHHTWWGFFKRRYIHLNLW